MKGFLLFAVLASAVVGVFAAEDPLDVTPGDVLTSKPVDPAVLTDPAIDTPEEATASMLGSMTPEERQAACSAAVHAALKKYRCSMDVAVVISQRGNQPILQILPIDEKGEVEQ